ncbi:PA3496 family putative envelope integrity protein [Legionella spiritensis]|uniref:Uncharacterized protein n=1 Tax=Legionella spiritensis TaxID=452 RepID=A0A0W0YWI2_LEGSP|nr:hypothetical protein [Legionella spiritensis]KTD61261.1 hypothetical protein Lspi_2881 [Legionella spiritensis]SNV33325.1 Uncharacterised protein [Legionella spiritensis]VEG92370.1 Uncharacterised protein [Legionella spiritensis]
MSTRRFEDFETAAEEFGMDTEALAEFNPTTKLERRRRIEELAEEKRLREELDEFGFA